MNERIEQLAIEATKYANTLMIDYLDLSDEDYNKKCNQEYNKKFAELIVKECVQSIEKTIETNCDTDSEKMGCEFAITDLLEHFGVEE